MMLLQGMSYEAVAVRIDSADATKEVPGPLPIMGMLGPLVLTCVALLPLVARAATQHPDITGDSLLSVAYPGGSSLALSVVGLLVAFVVVTFSVRSTTVKASQALEPD